MVLLVDDDPLLRMLASEALDGADFDVLEAEDAGEALDLFETHWPDLVLLDVVMPGLNGFDACRALRARDGASDTPVLIMTGLDDLDAIDEAYDAGATDFITKPINYRILGRRLHYMLRARKTLDDLRRSEQWLANAQRAAKLGYWEWMADSAQFEVTPAAASRLGLDTSSSSVHVDDLLAHVHEDDRNALSAALARAREKRGRLETEVRVRTGDDIRNVLLVADPSFDEAKRCWRHLGAAQDVTELRRSEAKVRELACFDTVTGLPNRETLTEQIQQVLDSIPGQRGAIFCVRVVNQRDLVHLHGPDAADDHARMLTRRLSRTSSKLDLLGRLGPDVFGAFVAACGTDDEVMRHANAMVGALQGKPTDKGDAPWTQLHVGVAATDGCGHDARALVHNGVTAAGLQSDGHDGRCSFYQPEVEARVRRRLCLEAALRSAASGEGLNLVYQPKVEARTGRPVGAEALARMRTPDLGPVSPGEFIPVAEASDMIGPLTEWVMAEAFRQAKAWSEEFGSTFHVAVNISGRHLVEPTFIETVRSSLERAELSTTSVELEITESALMSDVDFCTARLKELRDIGFSVALDDFGTGHSSLAYLHRFPVDTLKIDRSFVSRIFTSDDGKPIVETIMALAKTLRLQVVAEGVESEAEVEYLAGLGCDLIQGYFYSRPVAPTELADWVRKHGVGAARPAVAPNGTADVQL